MELSKIIELLCSPDENNVDLGLLQLSNVKGLTDHWFNRTAEDIFNAQLEVILNFKSIKYSKVFRITFKNHEPPFNIIRYELGDGIDYEREITDGSGGGTTTEYSPERLKKSLQRSIEYGHFIDELALKIKAELYNILIQK